MTDDKKTPIKEQIASAEKEKEAAIATLQEETTRQETLASCLIDQVTLPKTEEAFSYAPTALEKLIENRGTMEALLEKAKKVKASLAAFENAEQACEDILYETKVLAEQELFGDALRTVVGIKDYLDLDFGFETKCKGLLAEILAWSLVKLTILDEKKRYRDEEDSLPLEMLLALKEDAKALPCRYHDEAEKTALIEESLVLVASYYIALGNATSIEDLSERLLEVADVQDIESIQNPSAARILAAFKDGCVAAYSRFAHLLDSPAASYDEALALFRLKPYFAEGDIDVPLFVEPADEAAFRLAFLKNVCLKEDEEAFASYCPELLSPLETGNQGLVDLVAALFLEEGLSSEKRKHLNLLYLRLSFERKIDVLVALKGAPEGLITPLFEAAEDTKKKTIDLDKKAAALRDLAASLPPTLSGRCRKMIAALTRSPHARRVIQKSSSPAPRALLSKKAKFKNPLGKKEKKTMVKEWSHAKLALFWILAFVLPVLLAFGGAAYLYFYQRQDFFYPFYLLVPLVILLVDLMVITYLYAGRDERPAGHMRRAFGLVGLLFGAAALCNYGWPTVFTFFAPYGYTLIIGGALFLLLGYFGFRDKKKVWDFLLYLPLLLVELAALAFLVLSLMPR